MNKPLVPESNTHMLQELLTQVVSIFGMLSALKKKVE
jgi:hypothetical protein